MLLAACSSEASRPAPSPEEEGPSVAVALTPQVPAEEDGRRLRWSPYGQRLPLVAAEGGLDTELFLGPEGTRSVRLRLARSDGSPRYDRLFIDLDRDGDFGEGERVETTPTEQRGRFWSSFAAVVEVPVVDPVSGQQGANPYSMSLWYVEDPAEPAEAPVLRFSRDGWMEGRTVLDGVDAVVLVTESAMDGVYDQQDSWAVASADSAADVFLSEHARSLDQHNWLFERAYQVRAIDPSGRRVVLAPFDPGMTRAEEEVMNDDLKVDREAARSGTSVAFLHDFTEAQAQAAREGKPLFLDFETTWCGPCKTMDEWVYTAEEVVSAARAVVAVKIDGDEQRELAKRFAVSGYPTMILLTPTGEELRRTSGYVNVADMRAFLQGGEQALPPVPPE